jgi:hypothetical protein
MHKRTHMYARPRAHTHTHTHMHMLMARVRTHTRAIACQVSIRTFRQATPLPAQLICEAYQLMGTLLGKASNEMAAIFSDWNKGELDSYLIEITASILGYKDEVC